MGGLSHTVSGDIASFRTPSRVPIESLKFHFLPKQEGSGDPSPTNVRPITGWTGLNGYNTQESMFDYKNLTIHAVGGDAIYSWENDVLKIGVKNGTSTYNVLHQISMRWDVPEKLRGKSVIFFTKGLTNSNENHHGVIIAELRRSDGTLITDPTICSESNKSYKRKYTLTDDTAYCVLIFRMNQGASTTFSVGDYFTVDGFFANYPDSITSDPKYSFRSIPIFWSDQGEIYGGYVDPVHGKLICDKVKIIIDDATAFSYSDRGSVSRFTIPISDVGPANAGNQFVMFNYLKTDASTTTEWCGWINASTNKLQIFTPSSINSISNFTQYLSEHPLEFSYKIATPIEYNLAPQQLQAFLDHNNFWSDANDITEVTYAVVESKDMFDARKRIMSKTWNMLPLLYTEVEYISAKDSNPYIDMGIKFTGELEAEVHYYNDKNEAFLFGARKGASSAPYCNFNVESADRSRFDYGNQKAVATSGLPFAGYHDGEYIFKFYNRIATMEKVSTGEVVAKDYSSFVRTDYSDYNMLLFSVNTNGTPSLNTGTGELRVYSAKFWIGGQLVRNLVPCFRKSDNKPGMYDRVSKTFFTNAGSGEFSLPA